MLSIYITDVNGKKQQLNNVLSIVLNTSDEVPADDITVTIPYNKKIVDGADMISAYFEERLIFTGQIDEIVSLSSADRAVAKICARSLAGALLDNEAEPLSYYRPDADFIYKRHLKPYGIKAEIAENKLFSGIFPIEKGMSQWQVFELFCKSCYGRKPRVTGDGCALFSGIQSSEKVLFGTEGINYRSIRSRFKRCELISSVNVRLSEQGSYTTAVKNPNKNCADITRVRYVNAVADNASLGTADAIIRNSNAASRLVELECIGCFPNLIGKETVVEDKLLGRIDGLIVKSVQYSLGAGGEITAVTLGKEN